MVFELKKTLTSLFKLTATGFLLTTRQVAYFKEYEHFQDPSYNMTGEQMLPPCYYVRDVGRPDNPGVKIFAFLNPWIPPAVEDHLMMLGLYWRATGI